MAINTSDFNLQFAAQSARGVYPVNPDYVAQIISGTLQANPTLGKLNVGDAGLWTPSFKRTTRQEAGGSITLLMQPQAAAALLYFGMGAIATSGAADPYTHAITPATSAAGFPHICFWQKVGGRWMLFRDCQVTSLEVTVANDASEGFMLATIEVVGMRRPQYVAEPATPATAESDAYHWLDATGYWVMDGDWDNLSHAAVPTDLATLITWLTAYKASWNAHCAVATGRHHKAADATNTLSYTTPAIDLAACIAALTEIKTDHEAHRVNTTVHHFADATNTLSYTTPCADLPACLLAVQEIQGWENSPGVYNAHLGATAALKSFTFSLNTNASNIQGEDVTPYAVQRKRGVISVAAELLVEDWRIVNLVQFGDIAPTAGDEFTDEIQLGSLVTKLTASTSGNERSLKISVPQFDYDPSAVQVDGDPEGGERFVTIGGEASGTAPIVTIEVLNDVDEY